MALTPAMDNAAEVESLLWYHPTLSRHTAESMLIQNGSDGTYLLRPSSKGHGEYALRCVAINNLFVKRYFLPLCVILTSQSLKP